jgi:hypothetical protein
LLIAAAVARLPMPQTAARALHQPHQPQGGKHPNDLPQFRWINTLLMHCCSSFESPICELVFQLPQSLRINPASPCFVLFPFRASQGGLEACS